MSDTHNLKKGLIWAVILYFSFSTLLCAAESSKEIKLLGDVDDGSGAVDVHNIRLLDEEGGKISPDDFVILPFSTKQTCGACHNYRIISKGWHFNAGEPNVAEGRNGQPWIYVDAASATQIPLSYRNWPGVYNPRQLGLSEWKFTSLFGRHIPGGGVSEIDTEDYDEIMRQMVSGKLEINCLTCHNAHHGQDQAEFAGQIAKQNFRWAASGACEFAAVTGSAASMPDTYDPMMPGEMDDPDKKPPTVKYRENAFDAKYKVLFDIVRKVPNQRCYFCHSNKILDKEQGEKWMADEDVHIVAGLSCVDCHRNGLDHRITRGYSCESKSSTNPLAKTSTCNGCHISGRLGAPAAKHRGIPAIHFSKLTCTACHSGRLPGEKAVGVKTSRAHALGTHSVNKSDEALPHISTTVLAELPNGKIAPHNLIWPAFWGSLKDGEIIPVAINIAKAAAGKVIEKKASGVPGDWPKLTKEQIAKVLTLLSSEAIEGKAVYVAGGRVYQLDKDNELTAAEHKAAEPYLWPIAHNVRGATQSLGARSCDDCHDTKSGFFFGKVGVDTPLVSAKGTSRQMVSFQNLGRFYTKAFAWSFMFRPWFKVVTLCSCGIISAVLLLYGLKALACIARIMTGKD